MGWSCAADADRTYRRISDGCVKMTGSQNTFKTTDGRDAFFELPDKEHEDGAITGTIYVMISKTHARKAGRYRIEPDGTVARFDLLPREIREAA